MLKDICSPREEVDEKVERVWRPGFVAAGSLQEYFCLSLSPWILAATLPVCLFKCWVQKFPDSDLMNINIKGVGYGRVDKSVRSH